MRKQFLDLMEFPRFEERPEDVSDLQDSSIIKPIDWHSEEISVVSVIHKNLYFWIIKRSERYYEQLES